MAHQMVNFNRPFIRGFTVAAFEEAHSETDLPEASGALQQARGKSVEATNIGVVPIAEEVVKPNVNMMRRGSKSLPASPMGSPKSVRKNPYFTGIFTSSQNSTEPNRYDSFSVYCEKCGLTDSFLFIVAGC